MVAPFLKSALQSVARDATRDDPIAEFSAALLRVCRLIADLAPETAPAGGTPEQQDKQNPEDDAPATRAQMCRLHDMFSQQMMDLKERFGQLAMQLERAGQVAAEAPSLSDAFTIIERMYVGDYSEPAAALQRQQQQSPDHIWLPAVDQARLRRCKRCGWCGPTGDPSNPPCLCGSLEPLHVWINREIRKRIRSEVAASRSADKSGS